MGYDAITSDPVLYLYMPIFSRAVTTHDHLWRRRDPYLIPIRELGTGSMWCKRDWISSRSAARHLGHRLSIQSFCISKAHSDLDSEGGDTTRMKPAGFNYVYVLRCAT